MTPLLLKIFPLLIVGVHSDINNQYHPVYWLSWASGPVVILELVFQCYVTNYQKPQNLKQQIFIICLHRSGFWAQYNWVLCSRSRKVDIKLLPRAFVSSEPLPSFKFSWVVDGIGFLVAMGLLALQR